MKRHRLLTTAVLTALGVLGVSGLALAYWTVASTGATGSAAADSLGAPATVSTSNVTATSVTVNVTAAPGSGPAPTSYRVDRTAPASAAATGICTISGSTGSCIDSSPASGQTNTYAVYSKLGSSWVSASAASTSAAVPSSDTTPPTVTINQAATQADPTNNGTVTFTATFSETVTGFTNTDITIGGTAGGTKTAAVTGTGPSYTVTISGATGNGTIIASIPANAAQDLAGNNSTASTSTDNTVTLDTTAPTVTINQAAGQADPTNNGTITFTAVFSETVTGFTNSDVTIGGTAGGTKTAAVTGTGPSYTVTISGATGNGTIIASIPANAAQDLAGNNSTASTSTDNTVTLDTTAPTASDIQTTNKSGSGVAGQAEKGDTITYTFSETLKPSTLVSGWDGSQLSVSLRINNNAGAGGNDTVTVFDASNTTQVALGTVNLGRSDYVTSDVVFRTGQGSNDTTMTMSGGSVTVTLGSNFTGTITTAAAAGTMTWSPSTSATDPAGNAVSATSATESGTPSDKEF